MCALSTGYTYVDGPELNSLACEITCTIIGQQEGRIISRQSNAVIHYLSLRSKYRPSGIFSMDRVESQLHGAHTYKCGHERGTSLHD